MNDRNTNLKAYNSIELLSEYTIESMDDYRNSRIIRYQVYADFILERSENTMVSLIEIGSGNSGLLYTIAKRNKLQNAMGIELSKSRSEFAEKWKKDDGYTMVENVNDNFVNVDMGESLWDWVVVIDNTFTYLYPEDTEYPDELLAKAFKALKKGGKILIDFFNYASRTPDIEYKTWYPFSETDPYSYGLYSNKITDGINRTQSIFIKREGNGTESEKVELSKVYSIDELTSMLVKHGFKVEEVFASFDQKPFVANSSERLVVVAKKND